jgi:hypothetical protein
VSTTQTVDNYKARNLYLLRYSSLFEKAFLKFYMQRKVWTALKHNDVRDYVIVFVLIATIVGVNIAWFRSKPEERPLEAILGLSESNSRTGPLTEQVIRREPDLTARDTVAVSSAHKADAVQIARDANLAPELDPQEVLRRVTGRFEELGAFPASFTEGKLSEEFKRTYSVECAAIDYALSLDPDTLLSTLFPPPEIRHEEFEEELRALTRLDAYARLISDWRATKGLNPNISIVEYIGVRYREMDRDIRDLGNLWNLIDRYGENSTLELEQEIGSILDREQEKHLGRMLAASGGNGAFLNALYLELFTFIFEMEKGNDQ